MVLNSGIPVSLVMDRTDWEYGEGWSNLLVTGLCFEGYFIPLVWTDIGQRGNSNAAVRLSPLEKLAAWWPREEVPIRSFPLVADREFDGDDWLL